MGIDSNFWTLNTNTPMRNAWEGLAFERVCFEHIRQIKLALGISGVSTKIYSWRVTDDPINGKSAQIDMVIECDDQVFNLCEMKFSTTEYTIKKEDDENIRNKVARYSEIRKTRKTIHVTLITPYGIKENIYQYSIQNTITADDLFKE